MTTILSDGAPVRPYTGTEFLDGSMASASRHRRASILSEHGAHGCSADRYSRERELLIGHALLHPPTDRCIES
jgi:hypothetical protein